MTYKKARRIIKDNTPTKRTSPKLNKALEMANQALKKQIPKKPMLVEEYTWGIKTEQNTCPECFNFLPHCEFDFQSRRLTYCDICGQAIDWSEE